MTLIEQVVDRYFPGRKVVSSRQLSGGLINQTYRVELGDGENLIAQKMNTEVFSNLESIHRNIEVIGLHLNKRGYRYDFPVPLKTTKNSSLTVIGNETWRMLPFIPNSFTVVKANSSEMAFNAGMCLGHFHSCTEDFDLCKLATSITNFHSGMLRISQFEEANKSCCESGTPMVEDLSEQMENLRKWDELCGTTPKHTGHFDTKIENFLFKSGTDQVSALIDLDTIMPGSRLSDVGDMIRSFCDDGSGQANLKFRDAVIEGYLSEMKNHITALEMNSLRFSGAALTLMQSLRFMTDHLNGDQYYHVEFRGQNLQRAERQFALYQGLNS